MRLELIPTPRGVLSVREAEGANAFERAVATAKAAAERGRADA